MQPIHRGPLPVALVVLAAAGASLEAQRVDRVREGLLREVMPFADRFERATGDPPVREAFQGEERVGYVFLTSDVPPEEYGYSGPIVALVGMTLEGALTGVRVTDYRESYMESLGDFLRRPGFQEQFAGKYVGENFRVGRDVDGISRVSISVRALSRGVRNAARRVAAARSGLVELPSGPVADVVGLSWFELRRRGVLERFEVTDPGRGSAGITVAHLWNERVGEYLLGDLYERGLGSVARRGGADDLLLYAVDGSRLRLFEQEGWSIVQAGDTVPIAREKVVLLGIPSGGLVYDEASLVGLMMLDTVVDMTRPFTLHYDLGARLGTHELPYVTREARIAMAEDSAAAVAEAARAAREAAAAAEAAARAAAEAADDDAEADEADEAERGTVETPGVGAPLDAAPLPPLDFELSTEETLLERTLAQASWTRVLRVLFVIAVAAAAFFTKSVTLRWVSVGTTLVVLGFVDGGFLSISHVTSAIWVGPSVFANDLPLLLMVTFTVLTTLVWGRVFCGFLCPFGALQDVIDRVVPRSWQRALPPGAHRSALKLKYAVLALVLVPAIAGSQVSLYQYFEPFGTVFFLSPSVLLWTIAAAFLLASTLVPRFYCRYACPLGAALAVASVVSLRRIPRVEQCDHCKVCEQRCPTGAIEGPHVHFHECVRCNECEVLLRERAGVCRHDMEVVRSRLVQIRRPSGAEATLGG